MLEVARKGLEEIKEVENTQDLQSALDLAWQDQAMVEEMESFRNIILRVAS